MGQMVQGAVAAEQSGNLSERRSGAGIDVGLRHLVLDNIQWCLAIVVSHVGIRAVIEQQLNLFPIHRCPDCIMQRSVVGKIARIRIRAMLQQNLHSSSSGIAIDSLIQQRLSFREV